MDRRTHVQNAQGSRDALYAVLLCFEDRDGGRDLSTDWHQQTGQLTGIKELSSGARTVKEDGGQLELDEVEEGPGGGVVQDEGRREAPVRRP